jgi:hypothetical protein
MIREARAQIDLIAASLGGFVQMGHLGNASDQSNPHLQRNMTRCAYDIA